MWCEFSVLATVAIPRVTIPLKGDLRNFYEHPPAQSPLFGENNVCKSGSFLLIL